MSDNESEIIESSVPMKKPRKQITEKQKIARAANLAKGRAARAKKIAARKEHKGKGRQATEYELDTDSAESSSNDSYVLVKRK